MKVLFIDDEEEILYNIKRTFQDNNGVLCIKGESVKQALKDISCHEPDIVFLDHSFKNVNGEGYGDAGLKIVSWLRENKPGVKIYSMTNGDSEEYEKLGIEVIGKSNLKRFKEIIGGGKH